MQLSLQTRLRIAATRSRSSPLNALYVAAAKCIAWHTVWRDQLSTADFTQNKPRFKAAIDLKTMDSGMRDVDEVCTAH